VKYADDQDAVSGGAIEDHMGLVSKATKSGANLIGRRSHLRVLTQKVEATVRRAEVPFGLDRAEIGN